MKYLTASAETPQHDPAEHEPGRDERAEDLQPEHGLLARRVLLQDGKDERDERRENHEDGEVAHFRSIAMS